MMDSKQIEIEWMKELLKENELEIWRLRKDIKNLKEDLAFKSTMLDNVRAEYESAQNVIKKMKAELERYKKQYEHTMWEN